MNLKITAAVAAALACSAPAFASNLTTTISPQVKLVVAGSSAERDAFVALMNDFACQAGTFDVYRIAPTGNQDFRAYSCTILNNATQFGTAANKTATVYYRSEGGSAFGFAPLATGIQVMRLNVDTNCTTTSTATFAGTAGSITVHDCVAPANDYTLVGTTSVDADVSKTANPHFIKDTVQLGVGDEEPKMYGPPNFPSSHVFDTFAGNKQTAMNGLGAGTVGFGQLFSLIVNNTTGATGDGDATIINSPFNGNPNALQLGRSTIAGIFNGTYTDWSAVPTISGGRVSADPITIRVCRREPGSGTQVAAHQYFLGTPQCAPPTPGVFVSDGGDADDTNPVNDTDGVIERGATGDLQACVQALAGAIGFQSHAASPPTGTAFVLLNGEAPSRSAAAAGTYDWVYELTFKNNATGDAGALASGLIDRARHSASAPPVQSVVSLPNAFNDPQNQTDFSVPIAFGSRSGNTCSPIKP